MAMKYCPVCGWKYSDTYCECPFCKEDRDAGRETHLRARRGKRAARSGKRFRLIAGTQILLILVIAGSLLYLLRGAGHEAGTAGEGFASTVSSSDPASQAPGGPSEPLDPQAEGETAAADGKELPAHSDEPQSGVRNEAGGTSAAPAQGDAASSDSGTVPELRTGNAVVVHAENGVRVRSGPGTGSQALASVYNGAHIQVIRRANDGWYEITFLNAHGVETVGYMMGDFLENV